MANVCVFCCVYVFSVPSLCALWQVFFYVFCGKFLCVFSGVFVYAVESVFVSSVSLCLAINYFCVFFGKYRVTLVAASVDASKEELAKDKVISNPVLYTSL